MSTSQEGKSFSNISATTAAFPLLGGRYVAQASGSIAGGSVKLQALMGDGTTWVSVSATTDFTTAGFGAVDLPPGQYRFTLATATAVYCSVTRIPN